MSTAMQAMNTATKTMSTAMQAMNTATKAMSTATKAMSTAARTLTGATKAPARAAAAVKPQDAGHLVFPKVYKNSLLSRKIERHRPIPGGLPHAPMVVNAAAGRPAAAPAGDFGGVDRERWLDGRVCQCWPFQCSACDWCWGPADPDVGGDTAVNGRRCRNHSGGRLTGCQAGPFQR